MDTCKLSVSIGWPGSKSLVRKKHLKGSYVFPRPTHQQSSSEEQKASWFPHHGRGVSLDQMVEQALYTSPSPPHQYASVQAIDLTTELEDDDYELESMETVFCALPLRSPNNGTNIMLMGSQNGVWYQSQGINDSEPSLFRRVLDMENVFQLGLLPEANLLIVRSEEDLSLYRIESVVPEWDGSSGRAIQETKLAGHIGFFDVVHVANSILIVCEIRGFNRCSTLRIFELPRRLDTFGGIPRFRVWRDWNAGKPVQAVASMGYKLAVLSDSTVELVDLVNRKEPVKVIFDTESLCAGTSRTPDNLANKAFNASNKVLGCFQTDDDEYLLCYDKFGLFMNGEGQRDGATMAVEWKTGHQAMTASSAIYHAPFLYLFNQDMIEVRRLSTMAKAGRRLDVVHSMAETNILVLSRFSPGLANWPGSSQAQPVVISVAGKRPGVPQDAYKVSML